MSLLTWCRQTATSGLHKFFSPVAVQCRSVVIQPDDPDKPHVHAFGYHDRYKKRGLLTHKDTLSRVNVLRQYKPKDVWIEKRALFGQNDYIDILGNGEVHPVNTHYNIPMWLRGFNGGNPLAVVVRRRKFLSKTQFPMHYPTKWDHLNKKIRYLYRFLNFKTKNPLILRKK